MKKDILVTSSIDREHTTTIIDGPSICHESTPSGETMSDERIVEFGRDAIDRILNYPDLTSEEQIYG